MYLDAELRLEEMCPVLHGPQYFAWMGKEQVVGRLVAYGRQETAVHYFRGRQDCHGES